MRDHYDFSKAGQGKYAERHNEATNLVLPEPDVAKEFPDDASVNEALRETLREKKDSPE